MAMPSSNANVFKKHSFSHKGVDYEVLAFIEPAKPDEVRIQVYENGAPVVIIYPDKYKASLIYTVELATRIDFQHATGLSAVDELIKTAESDVKQLV
ncbi:hypothetical protein N7I30_09975 [Aurantimonas litoralis]|nr:hypothetical protein [Aurantimonas litoralis]